MRLLVALAIILRASVLSTCIVSVDPENKSGCASDDNNGAGACGQKGIGPVRSYRRAMDLMNWCIANGQAVALTAKLARFILVAGC